MGGIEYHLTTTILQALGDFVLCGSCGKLQQGLWSSQFEKNDWLKLITSQILLINYCNIWVTRKRVLNKISDIVNRLRIGAHTVQVLTLHMPRTLWT